MKKVFSVLGVLLFLTGFTIPGTIKDVTPSGGGVFINRMTSIQWTALGTTNPFKISLWKNGVRVGIIDEEVSAGNGTLSIPWRVGQYIGGTAQLGPGYRIKVKEKNKTTTGMSKDPFKIVRLPPATLKIKPMITGMFTDPLGALRVGSRLYINGALFGTKKGEILMYGNFPQSPVSLVDVNWISSKKVNGKVPLFNTTGLPDQTVEIRVKTAENVLSYSKNIGFEGRKEVKLLHLSDVVVVQCGDDANDNNCNRAAHYTGDLAISGFHRNATATIGDDIDDDIYQISLSNGWILKSMEIVEWHKSSGDEVLTGPSPAFPAGESNWTATIHWEVSPNDHVRYGIKITVEGPLGTHFK
jgi:hypothetical protein